MKNTSSTLSGFTTIVSSIFPVRNSEKFFSIPSKEVYFSFDIQFENAESHKYTARAAKLLAFCSLQLKFMKNCANCIEHYHENIDDWMVKMCDLPHLVVWVEIEGVDFWPSAKGFNCWPAKVLGVDGSSLEIAFFGHHQFSIVNVDNCYLYSGRQANFVKTALMQQDMSVALEVISIS